MTANTIPSFAIDSFTEYYKNQEIVNKKEWDEFMAVLMTSLPSCFRINDNGGSIKNIKDLLLGKFQFPSTAYFHGDTPIQPPKCLDWYPNDCGWQLDCGRAALRKAARMYPVIQELHQLLMKETTCGNISRQEAVSMIPAFLLNVQSEHKVLDICAAPGSKTAQLLEALHKDCELNGEPKGFVLANDINEKRAFLLVHQTQRLGRSSYVVTSHDGRTFPGNIKFDRVLCDVPCSGDGTVRKAPDAWKRWHVGNELSLHPIQIAIAMRSAALLNVGGLMVYSTCTFNPIANEAVVAEVLRRCDGALELVDTSKMLPSLKRRPGLYKWKVAWKTKNKQKMKSDKDEFSQLQWFDKYDDVDLFLRSRITRSMFPTDLSQKSYPLHHCLRLVPHDANTGGFFVALLRKKAALPGVDEEGLPSLDNPEDLTSLLKIPPPGYICKICEQEGHYIQKCPQSTHQSTEEQTATEFKVDQANIKKRDLNEFQQVSEDQWQHIKDFFGISDSFPIEQLYTRSTGATSISLLPKSIQKYCMNNAQLNIINTGIRLFTKISTKATGVHYRPTYEGLPILIPYLSKRILYVNLKDFYYLTEVQESDLLPIENLSLDSQRDIHGLREETVGPAVAILDEVNMLFLQEHYRLADGVFAIPIWIGNGTVNVLAPRLCLDQLQSLISSPELNLEWTASNSSTTQ